MTLEELRSRLDALGIPHDEWGKTQPAPPLQGQRETLVKIREFLQHQIQADQGTLAELHTTLQRLKHGGGV